MTLYARSVAESLQEKKATGCGAASSMRCYKTAPIPMSDALVTNSNACDKLGNAKQASETSAYFNATNADYSRSLHTNARLFYSKSVMGATINAKLCTYYV